VKGILYTNAENLIAYKEEIYHPIMMKMNPAILALAEFRLTVDINECEVSMPGYSMRYDGESRNTRGMIIYIKNNIRYEIVLIRKIESNYRR